MMMDRLSATAADALATLAVELRPEWDRAGVLAALRSVYTRGDAGAVIAATLRAARDPTAKTPAAIGFDQHWPPPLTRTGEPPRCPKTGHGSYYAHNCGLCRFEHLRPGDYQPEPLPPPAPRPDSTRKPRPEIRRWASSFQEDS